MNQYRQLLNEKIKSEVDDMHPLLETLIKKLPNVKNVEYTHGPNEMGSDIVFSKPHELLNDEQYISVIAKVGKIVQDFSAIERQIDECFSISRFFGGGKKKIRLNEVWVIVTENISKNAEERIHEKYPAYNVNFIDGNHLIHLINDYLPNYWYELPIDCGEYLNKIRTETIKIDKITALIEIPDSNFYIEQDIYKDENISSLARKHKSGHTKVDIIEEIRNQKILFIEGEMGSGKSKLLRHLIQHYSQPDIFLEEKILPVYTTFRELLDTHDMQPLKIPVK